MIAYWDRGLEWMGDGLQLAICPSFTGPTSLAALDVSGNANHGTLTNMDRNTAWVTSGGRGALDFDGVDDFVACGNVRNFPQNNWTVSAWGFPRVSAQMGMIAVGINAFASSQVLMFFFSATTLAFRMVFNDRDISGLPNMLNAWQHVVWTLNTSNVGSFYLNGSLIGTHQYSGPFIGTTDCFLGRGQSSTNRLLNGQLDDARIYNRVLTASEIRQMYERGRAGGMLYQPPKRRSVFIAAGFKAYWHRRQSQIIGGGV